MNENVASKPKLTIEFCECFGFHRSGRGYTEAQELEREKSVYFSFAISAKLLQSTRHGGMALMVKLQGRGKASAAIIAPCTPGP